MLYKTNEQSKINFIHLVNSFMLLDGKKTEEEIKLLDSLEQNLLNFKLELKKEYQDKDDIKKLFSEITDDYKSYLKAILLEINDENNYKEDGIISKLPFTDSKKGNWEKWIKTNL